MKIIKYILFWPLFNTGPKSGIQVRLKATTIVFRLIAFSALFYFVSGCFYYKAATSAYPGSGTLDSLNSQNKIFVIHADTNVFIISNIKLENDSLKGDYQSEYIKPFKQKNYPQPNTSKRYRRSLGEKRLLHEIHIYLRGSNVLQDSKCSFALEDIYRMDVYDPDTDRTILSWVVGIISAAAAVPVTIIVVFFFLLITGNSCPYVYVNTGHGYAFTGEIYSGAVYKPLERDDYLTLPKLVAEDGSYKLRITNELEEVQHTNLTELIVVDHPKNADVLMDKYGHLQTGVDIQSPTSATNFTGENILPLIKDKDSLSYLGVSPKDSVPLTDGMILTFDHPKDANSGKLFIRARNSVWLDNVYKNFHSMLGSYNDKWTEKQNKGDAKEMTDWSIGQKIPLLVYVRKNGEWVFADYYNMAGPMALKEDIIAVDLKGIDKGPVKIKLETGSYFWEIDYVGLDCSPNIPVDMRTVPLDQAITAENDTVTGQLMHADDSYLVQPVSGSAANLTFSVPPLAGSERTVILHSRGYYQIARSAKGLPQVGKLKKIRESGQFLEYSRELMKERVDSLYKSDQP